MTVLIISTIVMEPVIVMVMMTLKLMTMMTNDDDDDEYIDTEDWPRSDLVDPPGRLQDPHKRPRHLHHRRQVARINTSPQISTEGWGVRLKSDKLT